MLPSTSSPANAPPLSEPHIYSGHSDAPDAAQAAAELREQIRHEDTQLVIAFVSSQYDRDLMARHLAREFPGITVIGCTTAGEFGPRGYTTSTVAALSFGRDDLVFQVALLKNISRTGARECQQAAYNMRQQLMQRVENLDLSTCFALLLIDGLSGNEECVARAVHDGLGGIAMVGGSAGDNLEFRHTGILYDGRFHEDAALLLVAASSYSIVTFKTQHFLAGERRLVLTGAVPEQRVATEINGLPAAQEYARAIGVERSGLDPNVFSAHPLVVKIGGADFVRSIRNVNSDDSLTFFCAIDEGIVFNVSERIDLAANLEQLFRLVEQRVGPPRVVLGCDCILRRLEMEQSGTKDAIAALMRKYNVIGFNSYGEQFRGMHINQTFTGVAIGSRPTQRRICEIKTGGR